MVQIKLDKETIKEHERIFEQLDKIKEELVELKGEISSIRKSGKSTQIIEVKLLNIGPKVRMATITKEQGDVDKVNALLEDLKKEIEEAKKGDRFSDCLDIVDEIGIQINKGHWERASELYSTLRHTYRELSEDQRKLLYPVSTDIQEKIASRRQSII